MNKNMLRLNVFVTIWIVLVEEYIYDLCFIRITQPHLQFRCSRDRRTVPSGHWPTCSNLELSSAPDFGSVEGALSLILRWEDTGIKTRAVRTSILVLLLSDWAYSSCFVRCRAKKRRKTTMYKDGFLFLSRDKFHRTWYGWSPCCLTFVIATKYAYASHTEMRKTCESSHLSTHDKLSERM